MDERWAYPIPLTMQRQAGSAPKPHALKSPPVAPCAAPDQGHSQGQTAAAESDDGGASKTDVGFDY